MAAIDLREGDPLREFTADFLRHAARSDADKPFGIYYVAGDDDYAALARTVEREVFMAWFGNDDTIMDREYNPYDATSDFVLCIDHERSEPAGALRVIHPGVRGLKTLTDIALEPRWGVAPEDFIRRHPCPSGLEATHDIATLAVRPDWSGGVGLQVSHALYCGVYRWGIANGAEQYVALLDTTPYELLRSLGICIEPICELGPIEYLGSEATVPALISVLANTAAMRTDPQLRSLLGGAAADDRFSMPPITLSDGMAHLDGLPGVVESSLDLDTTA